eukprot:3302511-Karenia_brevis.AAC.1
MAARELITWSDTPSLHVSLIRSEQGSWRRRRRRGGGEKREREGGGRLGRGVAGKACQCGCPGRS